MRTWMLVVSVLAFVPVAGIVAAVALGGPRPPPPMASISDPFRSVDFSGMPPLRHFTARDGVTLAYRRYPGSGGIGSVVLVHGSSASSESMHPLGAALARAGFDVYSLDMRGHGGSGPRGRIAHVGQLEDEVEDFAKAVNPPKPCTLIGFSSGGGFALRLAGSPRRELFDRYVLLSPFLHQDAPTARPASGGWVGVGVPRIVALAILNGFGITVLNDLPVNAFAVAADDGDRLTPTYSYALATNLRPHDDYRADIRGASQPMEVLVGSDDEAFRAERFGATFEEAGRPTRVTVVPGVGHIGLTVRPAGIEAVVSALKGGSR
jgi:non-heme chloroperoxidase